MKNRWRELRFLLPALGVGILTAISLVVNQAEYPQIKYPDLTMVEQVAAESRHTAEIEEESQVTVEPETEEETGEETELQEPEESEEVLEIGKNWKDGWYTGSGQGFGGVIRVKVEIRDGRMTDIAITEHNGETDSFFAKAKGMISRILSAQSPNVEVVSSATYSSRGIRSAVARALRQAGGTETIVPEDPVKKEQEEPEKQEVQETEITKNPQETKEMVRQKTKTSSVSAVPADGTYTGMAVCELYGYTISLKVTFQDGKAIKMTDCRLINNTEPMNEDFVAKAWETLTGRILDRQDSEADAVSGATYSSKAICAAYQNAYDAAVMETLKDSDQSNAKSRGASEEHTKDKKRTDKKNKKNKKNTDQKKNQNRNTDPKEKDSDKTKKQEPEKIGETSEQTADPQIESDNSLRDGTYTVSTTVEPDAYEDFTTYTITADVTFEGGVLVSIDHLILSDTANMPYCNMALRLMLGLFQQDQTDVDAVTGATCSAKALRQIYLDAKEMARQIEEPEELTLLEKLWVGIYESYNN